MRLPTFTISFVLQKGKPNVEGKVPIMARLSINGDSTRLFTKMRVLPEEWDYENYKVMGNSREAKIVNGYLDELKSSIIRCFYDFQSAGDIPTPKKIKDRLFGLDVKSNTLLQAYDAYIEDYGKMVRVGLSSEWTLERYRLSRARTAEFIKTEYKTNDILLKDIDKRFIDSFYVWLRTAYQVNNNTAMKFISRFKTTFSFVRDNGWINTNPFSNYKMHFDKVDRGYLTNEEVKLLSQKEFRSDRLETIRDLFIFSCYTGLAYIDVKNLHEEHIVKWNDGTTWVQGKRAKTGVNFNVLLLDIPLKLIEKYKPFRENGYIFPVPSNQKVNEYLKEIAEICGIQKDLTFHLARHTFATTITLGNGVPIETVSKMLGHLDVKTTQIYARITDQKVSKDMMELADKLKGGTEQPTELSIKSKTRVKTNQTLQTLGLLPHLS